MTKSYYRPLVQSGPDRPDDAFSVAGGSAWFRRVALHRRDCAPEIMPAADIPQEIQDKLTQPRASIAGLAMNAPRIMGILNVTPDSFSDGGHFTEQKQAVAHAMEMVRHGAEIIDIGGESTRPGATEVSVLDEIARTAPVIAAIRAQSDVAISIDTRKAAVAVEAVKAGATLINDVAAFTFDPAIADVAANAGLPVCVMHAQGDPATMQADPRYDDVLLDVYDFLEERITAAKAAGITADQIVIDPGIGFGKSVEHNLHLLHGLPMLHALGCPILLGASRKRFIGAIGGGQEATDRTAGSVAVALLAIRQGVQFIRVHDTFETKQAIDLQKAINDAGQV